ncbi:MAG: hypothetical protein K6E76_07180 [Patescibacteria group bacterium]|nr:hypothetical protein [Patescibacteria group bacterium]
MSENIQTTTTPEKQGLSFHHGEIKIQRIQPKQQETTLQDKGGRIEGNSETFSKTVKKRDFEGSDAEFEDKIEEIFDIPEEKSIQEPSNEQQTNEISQENVQEKTENTQETTENSQEETEPQQEKIEENLPEMINPYDEVIHCLQEETCLTINQTLTTLKTTIIQSEEKNQEVQQEKEKNTIIQEIQTQLETFFAEMKNQPVDKEIKPHGEITPESWKPFFIIGILSSITFIATLIVFLLAQGKG